MADVFKKVTDFHTAFNLPNNSIPELPSTEQRELRGKLLTEEFREYIDAEADNDLVEIADALADIIYIACGTANVYGIPLKKVFDEVHRSNMRKLQDGKPLYREDGKVMKPEGWKPPNIKRIIDKAAKAAK